MFLCLVAFVVAMPVLMSTVLGSTPILTPVPLPQEDESAGRAAARDPVDYTGGEEPETPMRQAFVRMAGAPYSQRTHATNVRFNPSMLQL
jgi:hypothetical protein